MNECIFCKIVRGELPSTTIYEDEGTLAFLDINPVNPGHTLVIPKKHSENIFDISNDDWTAVTKTVHVLAPAIEKATATDGININMNNRKHAGQIVGHAHVHLIPRKEGDGLKLWPQKAYREGEKEAVAEKIRVALQ